MAFLFMFILPISTKPLIVKDYIINDFIDHIIITVTQIYKPLTLDSIKYKKKHYLKKTP